MSNDIRETFKRFREALNEAEEQGGDWFSPKQNGVPYTQQDQFLQTSINSAKQGFGADFSRIKTPMYYYQDDDDITLSGEIPSLGKDVKFQFVYKDDICALWTGNNEIRLNEDKVTKISRIFGVFQNWKREIDNMTDRKPMSLNNNE